MRFRILGPLRVGDGAGDRAVTAGRDRVVLAMLLLQPNRVVGVDALIDAVWEDAPPATARGQLQSCVSRLRRALPAVGVPATALVSDPAGYAITVADGELDADAFTRLVERARASAAAGRLDDAHGTFRAALALWRGPALAGVASRAVRHGAAVLDEQHAAAIEDRVDIDLSLGRHRDLVGELTGLVEQHPLRERLRGQLMVAYYRSGRQADALVEYRRARRTLRDELGIEPGPALSDLHGRMLTGEEPVTAGAATGSPARPPVRCLPRTVADFTGRADVVDRLVAAAAADDALAPVVAVIDGMAGSGKTTLAVHAANLVADRYPDAQLFIDLHGHSERSPVEPSAALVTLLRQLGVPGERIPAELDQRVALWRSELAARRALLLLDNAAGTAQVLPLLPASPGCLALVTSRRRLVGLDGVRPESLRVLPERDAVELLARVAGARVRAEPAAAAEVVRRCGYLPLAIRLAGARLVHRARWRVAELVERLRQQGTVLTGLTAEGRSVASAFALSFGHLADPARRAFRLLALFPGDHFDVPAVAALTGLSQRDAGELLDDLVDEHLIDDADHGRFRLHDLIREYAGELAEELSDPDRRAAVLGILDYYLHAATTLSRALEPEVTREIFQPGEPLRPDLLPAADTEPYDWLERERGNLDAVSRLAAETKEHGYTWMIARAAWRLWYLRSYFDDVIATHVRALAGAELLDDDTAVATAANYLASAYHRTDQPEEAVRHLKTALARWSRTGNRRAAALTEMNLAAVYIDIGNLELAARHGWAALAIQRREQSLSGISSLLAVLGRVEMCRGELRAALRLHRRHLLVAREAGITMHLAMALGNIGQVRMRLGEYGPALRQFRLALVLKERANRSWGKAETLNDLATIHRLLGRPDEAVPLHRQALSSAQDVGERRTESVVRNDLAVTMRAVGDLPAALELHGQALQLATTAQHPYEQARALQGMAACLAPAGPAAQRYRHRAGAIYRAMGVRSVPEDADHPGAVPAPASALRRPAGRGRMDG